jgi:hypothetical protein
MSQARRFVTGPESSRCLGRFSAPFLQGFVCLKLGADYQSAERKLAVTPTELRR